MNRPGLCGQHNPGRSRVFLLPFVFFLLFRGAPYIFYYNQVWDKNWSEFKIFFEYPQKIRKIIYTTNEVESYHRMVWKFTKIKAVFSIDDSIRKVIYMSAAVISKK